MDFLNNFNIILPEMVIILFIFIQLILSLILDTKFYKLSKWFSVLGIFWATSLCANLHADAYSYGFKNSLISGNYTIFFKVIILVSSFLIVFLTKRTITTRRENAFQFNALFLTAVLGALSLVSANDFLTMFIAMETLSFAIFFLIAFDKGYKSKEAAFKYLILSAVSSAVFLFGISYLYGISGTINFTEIYEHFLKQTPNLLYPMAAIFIICGVSFKLGVIPFANWILDVYEGSATSVAAFISIVPKVAMIGVFTRLLESSLNYGSFLLIVISLVTAVWANALAVRQTNIKRLLGCSSSSNTAYMFFVLGLIKSDPYNLSTVLFYLIAYVFMNIGVFSAIIILESSEFANKLYEFKNFAYTNPIFTAGFAICIMGLAGFPVTSGFIAKFYLLLGMSRSGLMLLPFLIMMLMTIAVSVYYYLTVVKYMFEKSDSITSEVIAHKTSSAIVILYSCAVITILLGIFPSKIIEFCQIIAYNI